MIRVDISEDARADLNEGFLFYEAQESGLGDYFIAWFRADIEGRKVSGGVQVAPCSGGKIKVKEEDGHDRLRRPHSSGA